MDSTEDLLKKIEADVKKYWDEYFSYTNVKTSDADVNTFMNGWSPYQAKVAFDIGQCHHFCLGS